MLCVIWRGYTVITDQTETGRKMEMRTPHRGRTTAPRSGGVHPWGTASVTPPVSPQTHAHPYTNHPLSHWAQSNPVSSGPGGTNQPQRRPRRAASLPGPPPEVRQHNRVPGTRTGRAAIWPGLFPVGFPLYRAPGWGQGHSPSSQPQKARVSHEGDTTRQVPRSQGPRSQWLASPAHG